MSERRRAVHLAERLVRRAWQPKSARAPVKLDARFADQLAQRPGTGPYLELDLEQPVTRDHVSECAVGVILRRREDVWHPATVVSDVDVPPEPGNAPAGRTGKFRAAGNAPDTVDRIQQPSERGKRTEGQCAHGDGRRETQYTQHAVRPQH